MDTWADALYPGLSVALAAGSNAAADQPALALLAAHRNNKLASNSVLPSKCVRLAKEFMVAKELAGLAPGGHYHKANGRLPYEGGPPSKDFPAFRAQLSKDAKTVIATHESAEALKKAAPVALLIVDEAGQAHELMAAMSLDSVIRSGGHLVLVGGPKQLTPHCHLQKGSRPGVVPLHL
jgi:hypothetical protein